MLKRLAFAAVAVTLLTGASGYYVDATKNKFLSPAQPIEPGTEITVRKGDIVLRAPVGRSVAAFLEGDLSLAIAGQTASIAKGTELRVMKLQGGTAGSQLGVPIVFCSEANYDAGKAFASLLTLGLASSGRRTAIMTQFCLADTDRDGLVEKAFLVGAKRAEDLAPVDVTPTKVVLKADSPLPGESEARLRFHGNVGYFGNIGFDLEVVESGNKLKFSNGLTYLSKKDLPKELNIYGARLTVLSYDPDKKEARVRIDKGFKEFEYSITTTTSMTYIPIYIRR